MPADDAVRYVPFEPSHVDGVVRLCRELDWPSYADPEIAGAALGAPGAVTWVALVEGEVVGLAHLLTNGLVHAHLSLIGVRPDRRRAGIARTLVTKAFRAGGGKWLDLCSDDGAEEFYRSFRHQERAGFRIHPGAPAE